MFSKNFYEIDEVVASLTASLFRQAPIETLFWAKELIDSSATSYLIETLILTYTLRFGHNRLEFINVLSGIVLRKTWSEHDLMRATYLLTLIDSSCTSHEVLDYLLAAEGEGLKAVSEESVRWLGRKSAAFDGAMHYLMEVAEPSEESLEPLELPKLPSVLKEIFGEVGRKRRFFPVVARDLYGSCRRGFMKMSETTDDILLMAHKTYYTSHAWRAALGPEKAYSDKDDEVGLWEEWMQKIFPDDIPDEWSKEERQKSHGPGVLRKDETVLASKWIEFHLGLHSRIEFDKMLKNKLPHALFCMS